MLARLPVTHVCSASAVQGNCSDPDVATALELPGPGPGGAILLPLKPYQCMLLLPDTFLAVEKGRIWADNLYLKLQPRPQQVLQDLRRAPSFITVGRLLPNSIADDYTPTSSFETPPKTNLHLTDITFQGDKVQAARGIYLSGSAAETSVYVTGERPMRQCIDHISRAMCVESRAAP